MIKLIFAFLAVFFTTTLHAGDVPEIDVGDVERPSPTYKEIVAKKMNDKEKRGSELAKQWINKKALPVREDEGKIVYMFGATLPSVICAPLMMCDIELQAGEQVRDIGVGDKPRWIIRPAVSGQGANEVTHVTVKPTEAGLTTILMITTNRRTYRIKLVSHESNWMPFIGFTYQSDMDSEWQNYFSRTSAHVEKTTIPETREKSDNLNFDYEMTGSARWKPVRIYNDGLKTYIQMPKSMSQTEAPALLILGTDGSQQLVNYRLKQDRYIVDQIFAKAILISGVGSSQAKITITYKPLSKNSR
ncbi:MAG: P-type conjugative transfer protein TrbG [Proteobacteria bacterium]|nr:MAG: P-type conjugative transfer protein TrbG [Pseudomonadota bacterium]